MAPFKHDVVVVGSGPNGLAAAVALARVGLTTLVVEARGTPGGGCRSAALTLPGFTHDVCSAVHPLAVGSPFFRTLSQPSLFDDTRAPAGKHTAWAYCHVPHGSTVDVAALVEEQVERFAPGFQATILARSTKNAADMERYDPNYIGGDINGGAADLDQLFFRPVARTAPYATPNGRLFMCSSSTPPDGGVHGMCGYWAAESVRERLGSEARANRRAG